MFRPRLAGSPAFFAAAIAFMTIMAAAGAPSALLVVYQERWQFPDGELTVAFAIYALTLLLALLTVGSLSDRIGRKPVIVLSLVLQCGAMLVFLLATDVVGIIVARAIQGAATGAATSAFSAYILEVAPDRMKRLAELLVSIAAVGGLGIGVILTGIAIQLSSTPDLVVFGIALVVTLTTAVLISLAPETLRERQPIGRTLIPRIHVPVAARRSFLRQAPGLLGIWMSAGLILGLGASLARQSLHVQDGLLLGLVVAAQPLTATLATLFLAPLVRPRVLLFAGLICVLVGVTLEAISFGTGNTPLLLFGAMVTGIGFGGAFSRMLAVLVPLTAPHERAGMFAAVYVLGYLAYGGPAIAAGFLSDAIGLVPAACVFALATLIVTAIGLVTARSGRVREPAPAAGGR